MHYMQHRHYFERFTLPLLSITGSDDRVTPPNELGRILHRVKNAQHKIIPHAFHDVMNESDVYRNQAWKLIDTFLG